MKKIVLGLMSGTSLDGIDIALCEFVTETKKSFASKILATESCAYTTAWKKRLENALSMNGEDLSVLDIELGLLFGEKIISFCKKNHTKPDFISSHGHTVFHQPVKKLTLQIGNGEAIWISTHIPTICNFRIGDVLIGGQGAPLVPMGERYLFPEHTIFLNLGGIANLSFHNEALIAFDSTVCNMVLNALAEKKGEQFDRDGHIAEQGVVIKTLISQINSLPFFQKKYPKSLGVEWFLQYIHPFLDTSQYTIENLMRTFAVHIAEQINKDVNTYKTQEKVNILVTGGGTHNTFLFQELNRVGKGENVFEKPDKQIIDYKEAIIFAFLGFLRYMNIPNALKNVTGASSDTSNGVMHGFCI
ncbi:MAG: anhydro-N-acetylmuramic acid kinase [Chitinophagaceae bacterium]|nr:anhydro-N-acetylmuramic acid kinase [Chitinophagaceae bacterium]